LATFGELPIVLGSLVFLLVGIFGDDCSPSTSINNLYPLLNSLYTPSEIKDITNITKDCPCFQK
jgi:hypothetical protein